MATVSRVFNDSPKVIGTTRERVLEAARELEYVPNAAARALVRRRSQLIGVVLSTGGEHPDIQHPFFQDVLVGLKRAVGALAYDLLLFATERPLGGDRVPSYLSRALHHGVDGLVLMGSEPGDPETKRLLASALPAVAVDLDVSGPRLISVSSDNLEGGRLAARHLRTRGHERIATIAGPSGHKSGVDRLLGFREELGGKLPRGYVVEGDFYAESGYAAMRALLALPEPPSAVFAASDLMAVGAIRAVREAGLDVPHDVAVLGFDDIQIAPLLEPALTTIRQDKTGLGAAAGESVIALVENPEARPGSLTLPVELVVRRSA